MNPKAYRHNHYVPEWYQKRFVPPTQADQELYYLDLKPRPFRDQNGVVRPQRNPKRLGYKFCFAEDDLYTTNIAGMDSTQIEQRFFGAIDNRGRKAVDYYSRFAYPWDGGDHLSDLLRYMSVQKLRTPKGLGWLADQVGSKAKNEILGHMLRLQQLHCAIWAECVWLIADASESATKFIVTDHPVAVYNRRCGPRSQWCRGNSDPEIWLHATQTIFPLSLEKVLLLTNLSWVRNPYQSEVDVRPNPNPFRGTIFKVTDIQTLRHLTEHEVRQINFIMKSRAHRYIGAAKPEWLYPEEHVTKSDWNTYGSGYLLMPDPRSVTYSGQIIIGNKDGTATAFDEYGRRPWQQGFRGGDDSGPDDDWNTFQRFNGEFATLFGPERRGRAFNAMRLDNERDDDDFHEYHLNIYRKYKEQRRRPRSKRS
jgi:hypothetical protein